MTYRQPQPSERRYLLLERRPRRLGDINWREIVTMIAWAGAVHLPVVVFARLSAQQYTGTLLGWLPDAGVLQAGLTVVGAAGVGFLWFGLIAVLVTLTVIAILGLMQTPVRQDWLAGFLAGTTAVIATSPITAPANDRPAEYLLGPLLAIALAQLLTTYVATRELKRYVRGAFWSADAQIIANSKSMNLQLSLGALFGATTVASLVMGMLKLSGLLEVSVARLVLSGFVVQLFLLPLSVRAAHWLLKDLKVEPLVEE